MMATQQQATPDPTIGPDGKRVAVPQGGSTSTSVQQPIGVPYYVIDPQTGQPAKDAGGNDVRFGVNVPSPNTEDDLSYRGGLPGSRQIAVGPQSTYQLPRYFDGAQWLPAQLPPDQLALLQKRMVAAGLLKPNEAQLGVWDQASMSAYTQLLAYANASGLDAGAALDQWGQAHTADPNAGRAPLTVQVSNPDDLRTVFRKAVIDTLGQGWDKDKIQQMVNAYQGVQTQAQTQAYNQQLTGGTTVQPPSAENFAATQARSENPLGAQEHDLIASGGPLDAFKAMLKGWS